MANARARVLPEHPTLNTIKPTKPPTYEGARQGVFTQWAFQVKQYLRLMRVHDKAYCVEFAANQFRGTAALWWQNLIQEHGEGAIQTWQEFVNTAEG